MVQLRDAFVQIAADEGLAQRFSEDPAAVLRDLGVDPAQVSIQRIPGGDAPDENVKDDVKAAAADRVARITVCGSVGYLVCASVGG